MIQINNMYVFNNIFYMIPFRKLNFDTLNIDLKLNILMMYSLCIF